MRTSLLRALLSTCAIIIAPNADDARHRALGDDAAFVSIVRIDHGDSLGGTGTLIAPTWILTAAHVVAGHPIESLSVRAGARRLAVRRAIAHPAWQRRIDDPDLALVELVDPVTGVQPFTLARELPAVGSELTLVGYGAGGPQAKDRGVKRGATNRMDQAGGVVRGLPISAWHLLIDFDDRDTPALNAIGDSLPTALEGINSGGDSGGPWLERVDGAWRIAAVYHVTSYSIGRAMGDRPRFGGAVAMGIGIAPFHQWIDSIVGAQEPIAKPVGVPTRVVSELREATGILEDDEGSVVVLLFERGSLARTARGLEDVRMLPQRGAFGRLMALEDGRFGVTRQDRQDVLVVDRAGRSVDSIATPAAARTFVIGPSAAVALLDAARRRYEESGNRTVIDAPLTRSLGAESRTITTIHRKTPARMTIGAAGAAATGGSAFEPVDAWALAPDGRVAVVRGREYRVTWFSPNGDSVVGPAIAHTGIPVTDAHRETFRREQKASLDDARRMLGGGLGDAAVSLPEPAWPATLPAMRGDRVLLSGDGTLWIPRHGAAPAKATVWDAFDARGERRNRVAIPEGWTLIGAGRGTLYLIGSAGLGVVAEP